MKYQMYYEMMEQPDALRRTFASELDNMANISKLAESADTIYLIGCGSSISTCYSIRDALSSVSDLRIEVFTGYEFLYNKKLTEGENSLFIATSQSGETADTLAALRRANEFKLDTVAISNEPESSMIKEAKIPVITLGNKETAILGTKTYITQLACLYQILFAASGYEKADEILDQLSAMPDLIEKLLETTEEDNKKLAEELKDELIFYCLGSGVNYGLAYKLAMTMLMEGAIKHACPLYSSEYRHGLIERAEKDVPLIFLDADLEGDELTKIAIRNSGEVLGAKAIVYNLKDYADVNPLLAPFVLVIPLEWFVYYLAHFNGEDPGSTRHIGKVRYE